MSDSWWPHGLYSPRNSPGQNTGAGSLSLLRGIFLTQGSNPVLPHCRRILYQLSHKRNPTRLEWVAYPFSSWSSWPRNQTGVSCIAGRFFTNWAIREAHPRTNTVFQLGESDQLHQTFLLVWENQHQRPGNWVSSMEQRGQIPPDMAQERISAKSN